MADFNRAIELNPSYAWAIAGRGRTYRDQGRLEDALADFNRAIELKPDDGWNHYELGLLHLLRDEPKDAERQFHQALRVDLLNIESSPFSARIWFNIAVYLLALGGEGESEDQIRAALAQGASPASIQEIIDDLRGFHRTTGRNFTSLVTVLTELADGTSQVP